MFAKFLSSKNSGVDTPDVSDDANNSQDGELFKTLFIAFAVAIIFRSFAFEPFHIPSGSMKSTLLIGDYLFVSKYSYGYSRFSLPFAPPLFDGRIGDDRPARGDIVVFRLPTQTNIDYIKRIVGLPGDRIQVRDGILYINDIAVPRERKEDFIDHSPNGDISIITSYIETLPNGVSYTVLDDRTDGTLDNTMVYTVPEGHYFAMGDNRDNSTDSRVLNAVGYVPEELLIGKAQRLFFSVDGTAKLWEFWKWPSAIRFERLFADIEKL